MTVGAILICVALFMVARYAVITKKVRRAATEALDAVKTRIEENSSDESTAPRDGAERETPVAEIDGTPYLGVISIPAAGIELPLINEFDYTSLNIAPCRYRGGVDTDDIVIVGHNYSSHFGRLSSVGVSERVNITLISGDSVSYVVTDRETVNGRDVGRLDGGDWDLTLITCDMTGDYRLLLRCKRF